LSTRLNICSWATGRIGRPESGIPSAPYWDSRVARTSRPMVSFPRVVDLTPDVHATEVLGVSVHVVCELRAGAELSRQALREHEGSTGFCRACSSAAPTIASPRRTAGSWRRRLAADGPSPPWTS